jgi:hypothetical protein
MTAIDAAVTLDQRATPTDDILMQNLGDEIVLLDLKSEHYFGLNMVGSRIWALLTEARNLSAILDALCDEFDAPREHIETDLLAIISSLREAGLVTVA